MKYAILFFLVIAAPLSAEDLSIWYTHPGTNWMTDALPIGNGRLGAMVFGDPHHEQIVFNEDSLWTGTPVSGDLPGGAEHIKEIQQLIAAGQTRQATSLIQQYLYGSPKHFGAYQPFGTLLIVNPAITAGVSNFKRVLDLSQGMVHIYYQAGGATYDEDYFASYPDQAIVIQLRCDQAMNRTIQFAPRAGATASTDGETIHLKGSLADNGINYEAAARVHKEADGKTVTIVLCAATALQGQPAISIPQKSFADLLAAHEKDYQVLFGRVNLHLGDVVDKPTDERLMARQKGAADPALDALYFQFGRYLLISSSRPGGLPSNRQGLWNGAATPQWGSDFPTMMNLEMMYWPAETANLPECAGPLIDMIGKLSVSGQSTAKTVYGARGWVVNYTTNPWGFSAAGTSPYQYFPAGAAWLCQHLWEHYAFTQDQDFLAKTAYPIMKSAAQFWVDHLIADSDGTLVSSPSESPEQGPFTAGATMDQEIVWDLFTNSIAAEDVLKIDSDFKAQLTDMRSKLSMPKVGNWGQLQEWKADIDQQNNTHRHVSHLFALYPGHQISPETTPDLAAAARKTLDLRGDGGPAWGWAWKIGFWARLGDGDHAHLILNKLLTPTAETSPRSTNAGTYENFFAARPPLQVDANLAATAAIAEMLVQSQNSSTSSGQAYEIRLLPALPKAWPDGSVSGLRARGGYTVGETWKDGALVDGTIEGQNGRWDVHADGSLVLTGQSQAFIPLGSGLGTPKVSVGGYGAKQP